MERSGVNKDSGTSFAQVLIMQAFSHLFLRSQGRVGPDGKELFPAGSTPGMRGFSFMAATPSPRPGAAGESPFMTWGEVEGTPFALDEVRASPAPLPMGGFRVRCACFLGNFSFSATFFVLQIPDVPEREKLAHELAEKAHRRHRADKAKAMQKLRGRLSSPASSLGNSASSRSARLASLSPAALRLSAKLARPASGSLAWNQPSASPRRHHTPSPRTPSSARGLTSGLLNLTSKKA